MNKICAFGEYTFEFFPMVLTRGVDVISLASKQLETLAVLIEAGGEVVHKEVFLEKVWAGAYVEEHNLTQTIFMLRRTLGKLPDGNEYIETVPRVGYRLNPSALTQAQAIGEEGFFSDAATVEKGCSKIPKKGNASKITIRDTFSSNAVIVTFMLLLVITASAIYRRHVARSRALSDHVNLVRVRELTRDDIYKLFQSPLFERHGKLFFTEILHNSAYLASVSTTGNQVRRQRLALPYGEVAGLHPSKDLALFTDIHVEGNPDETIFSMSSNGVIHQPIGELIGHAAAWSPDGSRIVVLKGNEILLSDSAGEHPRVVATLPGATSWPSWSPDGRHVRLTVQGAGARENIWEMDISNGNLQPLVLPRETKYQTCCGSWAPNGKYYVYLSGDSAKSSIWVRKESESLNGNVKAAGWEVASGPVDFWRSPIISNDGKHIFAVGEQAEAQLIGVDGFLKGSHEPLLHGVSIGSASYSHDGQWIVYTLYPEGSLWKSRSDGSEKIQISANNEICKGPQWAPDGSKLLYLSREQGGEWNLRELHVADGKTETLLTNVSGDDVVATYSPSGTQIVFGHRLKSNKDPKFSVAIFDLGSKRIEEIVGSEEMYAPKWSPDGRYIAALTVGQNQLVLYNSVTKTWNRMPVSRLDDAMWNKKGDLLYFTLSDNSADYLMKMDVSTRKIEQVADISNLSMSKFNSFYLSLLADDQIAFTALTGSSEVYDLEVDLP